MKLAPFSLEADATATLTQRAFLRMHRIQLTLIVLAALVGVFPWVTESPAVDWGGVIAATFFGTSLLIRLVVLQRKDENVWYSARESAEVSKSLCYRFAFGATGFERPALHTDDEAERRLIDGFATLGSEVVLTRVVPRSEGFAEITDDMRQTRALDFDALKRRYSDTRLTDQEQWYSAKAAYHLRRSHLWLTLMLTAEVGGLLFGILKAVLTLAGSFGGLVGLMSALAAAFLAWSQLRQHALLAGTYQNEAVQLRDLGRRVLRTPEAEWPEFVARAEDSIIAEQTRWQGLLGYGR